MDDRLNRAFAALADPTRRALVARLSIGDATVGELAAPFDVSLQAISKHLRVLEDAGLVSKGRDGTRRLVHLESDALGRMTSWIEQHQRQAEERYQRLDAVLGGMRREPSPVDAPPARASPSTDAATGPTSTAPSSTAPASTAPTSTEETP